MRALVASLLVGALVVVGAVRADAEPDHAAALSSLKRGVDAFRAGRYRVAVPEFEAAQKLAPDKPNPYRWLALAYMQLGNCPRVLVNTAAFLARAAAADSRRAELVRLQTLCRNTGVLRVHAEPVPAQVSIDGQGAGTTPYTSLSMRAGNHTVEARRSGYSRESRVVAIAPGGQHHVTFRLSRSRRPLVRRWWFWTAVAGTAAAVATTVVLLSDDSGATMLPPIRCGQAGCR